jgi:hypothetical protein
MAAGTACGRPFPRRRQHRRGTIYLVIKPSALPTGAGLAIFVGGNADDISMPPSAPPGTVGGISEDTISISDGGHVRMVAGLTVSPVHANQQCTG